jgi:chromate transporter
MARASHQHTKSPRTSPLGILGVFLKLGLTSFGGPTAHIGFFHHEFVKRRHWLTENAYADLVALCQFLPGPASSQLGFSIGLIRGGWWGGAAAWLGFTLPSAAAMISFAYGVAALGNVAQSGWIHGLKIAAVAVVAQAVWAMGNRLCPDRTRASLALASAIVILAWQTSWSQVAVIALAAVMGWILYRGEAGPGEESSSRVAASRRQGTVCLILFFGLLAGAPVLAGTFSSSWLSLFDSFYRSGALVFGGGHVVLPLLQAEVVPPGWVSNENFLAGYGAAQALPGPLFTFASYLGAVMNRPPNGWAGGLWCLASVFLPAILLVGGALPFWETLRQNAAVRAALKGANAAVVGLLLAALYHPVWTGSIRSLRDVILALAGFGLLQFWKWPPWMVVVLAALAGWLLL